MSNSETPLVITARDECAELYLENSTRVQVASGLGRLETSVVPGFYKVSQRIGDIERSEIIEVSEDAAQNHIELEPLDFASAIPLHGTTTTREFQQAAMYQPDVTHSFGGTGSLFLMIRDAKWHDYGSATPRQLQFIQAEIARLSFESLDGRLQESLRPIGHFEEKAGWFIAHLVLPPGAYVLVQHGLVDTAVRACLPLEVVDGWSPQVFIQIASKDGAGIPLDLDRASIAYAPRGKMLSPVDPDLRLLEVARKALSRGRSGVAPDVVERWMASDFQNPMLGLLAAHLLLAAAEPDTARAAFVIEKTAALLGQNFPDIVALGCKLAAAKRKPRDVARLPALQSPPLLAASWAAAVGSGSEGTNSVVDRSFALRFAFTAIDTSTWFVWREQRGARTPPPPPSGVKSGFRGRLTIDARNVEYEVSPSTEMVAKLLKQLLAQQGLQPWIRELRANERAGHLPDVLTPLDKTILSSSASTQASLLPGIIDIEGAAETLARSFSVPAAAAVSSLSKLLHHLNSTGPDQSKATASR